MNKVYPEFILKPIPWWIRGLLFFKKSTVYSDKGDYIHLGVDRASEEDYSVDLHIKILNGKTYIVKEVIY